MDYNAIYVTNIGVSWIIIQTIDVYDTNLYNTRDRVDLAAGDPGRPTVLADHRGGRCSWS